ncbi:MAG TPA: hypothetical protein VFD83_05935 [Candidatus Polarisedimenticolia bacterium]|nr:hypothetical protein [Candidatus Polarisedimenticolia bacterium]
MISALLTHMGLGLLLGFRHAFEADHLAAVATIVSREKSPVRAGAIGACWGSGHLTSLLLIGLPVVGLGLHLPRGLDLPLELGVAAMIVFLGVGGLTKSGSMEHRHTHSLRELGRRPFGVGMAHGLAGSGALTLVILATMPSRREGLFYLGSFGFGSILGMVAASAALSVPIALSGISVPMTARIARTVSLASIVFGIFYGFSTLAQALGGHGLS